MVTVPEDDAVKSLSWSEEWANGVSHALGAVLSLAGSVVLLTRVQQNDDPTQFVACCVYAASLVAVYTASSLSHFVQRPKLRHALRVLDQAFIYLLIVGTYTPVAITDLYHGWLIVLFWTMWGIALFGVFSKTYLRHRIEAVSTVMYVVLGWMPALAIPSALSLVAMPVLVLFVAGGLCYTIGVYFLVNDVRVRYFHLVWHLLVMAGSGLHFLAVYECIAA